MKTILLISLATLLISCGPTEVALQGQLVNSSNRSEITLHDKLVNSSDRLVEEKNKAFFLFKQAREAYWPDDPKLDDAVKINKETVDCAEKTRLPEEFYNEMHRDDQLAPDSHFMKELTDAYNEEADCYEDHNREIRLLMDII